MDKAYYFTTLGAKGEVSEYVAKGYQRFEDLPESEKLWLMDLYAKELPTCDYDYLVNEANHNGELTSYVLAALNDASKQEELMQKLRELLEEHLNWQINELFEAELEYRANNPDSYMDDAA
jgi:hypothetical protein